MKLSEEMAVRLHRMMWSDMQKELGDRPSGNDRLKFKREWVERNFPGEHIANDCWLCEYASSVMKPGGGDPYCKHCPISWPDCHCNTLDFSYAKDPISDILALPAKSDKIMDEKAVIYSYYKYREDLLSKASGIPASSAIDDHVKAIQEKAVEDYFKKTPGAKLATMDVDQAFKQYADEQKAPIFRTLAEASGLSADNESVKEHVYKIRTKAECDGRKEKAGVVFKALSVYSGVSEDNWSVYDHAMAIMKKTLNEKELDEAREKLKDAVSALNLYRSTLSYESNLPSSATIADHIKQIREYAFSDGQDAERERIMDKIGEMLNDKSTGTTANS